jgi:hypothetical protein
MALIMALALPHAVQPALARDTVDPIVSQLFAALNEPEAGKRDGLVAKVFIDSGILSDVSLRATGHKAIAARIEGLQRSLPGQKFQLIGQPLRQHDAWRIAFEVVDNTGSTTFEGLIFAVTANDNKFERVDIFTGPSAVPLP